MADIGQESRLIEYQKAQDSAEHHDNLTWTIMGVVLGGMFFLLIYSFEHVNDQNPNIRILVLFISVFSIYVCHAQQAIRERECGIIKEKYRICKEIEQQLGMQQHRIVDRISSRGRKDPIVDFIMWAMQFPWYYIILRIILSFIYNI